MKEKVRYISTDLLRGLVIIIMIEVHVFNAFLLPELKQTGWFSIINFINGLVAPSFLFVSGFAFQVSSGNQLDEIRKFGKVFWKKLQRIFLIIILGYTLHLPVLSFSELIYESTPQQFNDFLIVDVLQCIGFGLLFLFILRIMIKSDKIYDYFVILSFVVVTLISPVLWKIDFNQYVHPIIGNYFNKLNGSLFPIFPWLNFLLVGSIFAKYFVNSNLKNEEEKFVKKISIIGLIALLFGHLFYSGLLPESITSIIPNPIFFLERLGYIFILFSICWYIDKIFDVKKSFIIDASRESLLIYWLHLVIIYGMFWGDNSLASKIGMTMNIMEASGTTLLLIMVMILIAKLWGWVKKQYPKYSLVFIRVFVILLLLTFFVK